MELNPKYVRLTGPTWIDGCWACGKPLRPDRSNVCDYCSADQHRDFSPRDEEKYQKKMRELDALLLEISNKVKQEKMKK